MHLNGIRKMTRWTMIKQRHNIIVISLSALIACSFWIVPLMKKSKTVFSYKIFKTADGWGYDILVNDTLQIHQDFVPVITNKQAFPKQEQAKLTAELVIRKMRAGASPAISRSELESICPVNDMINGCERKP